MKRNLLWTAPALVAALWMSGTSVRASAQSLDGAADTATEAAADTSSAASDSASSTTDATGAADTSAATGSSTDAASAGASTSSSSSTTSDASGTATDASAASTDDSAAESNDASASASGQLDAQTNSQLDSDSQPSTSASASQDASAGASANAQAPTPPATQPGVTTDLNANANLSTDAAADRPRAENQAPGSATADAAAATDVDASLQGDADIRANAQLGAQQNLQRGLEFGQATDRGLAINAIAQDHFFYDSGLRRGDVLVSYAGHPIRSHADFNRWVAYQPGQRVPVVVLRDGRPQTIYIVYEQRQGVEHQASYAPASGAYLGVTFDTQHPQQAVVRTVVPGSPAEQAGINSGDVIMAVNGNRVGGSQDVIRIVQTMQPGQAIDVAISRQVVLGNRPGVAQAGYAPDVRIQGSATRSVATPPVPAPTAGTVETGAYVDPTGPVDNDVVVPGSGRYDNTPARAGDSDRDGRLLDADGRVGPVEGRAILPRRRN